MKPIFSTQIIARLTLCAFIFMTEILATFATKEWHGSVGHDAIYISITLLVLLATFLLGNSRLVVDFRDLCFYDVIVLCVGWWLYHNGFGQQTIYALLATILNLKFVRMLWPIQNANRDALADWPVFGPFGYWQTWQQRNNIHTPIFSLSKRNILAYLVMVVSFPVIYALREMGIKMPLAFWAGIGVLIVLYNFSRFQRYLEEREIQHLADAQKAAAQEATACMNIELEKVNARLAESHAALQQKNVELETQHQELAHAHATTRQLLAEREQDKAVLEKYNEAMRDAAHDLQHPMVIVRLYADHLIAFDEEGGDAQQRHEIAQELRCAMDQMVEFIDATIHSAQVVTGLIQPRLSAVDVTALAIQFQGSWLDAANHRDLEGFDVFPNGKKPILCAVDLVILQRILRNLIANAIQYTRAGGAILLSLRRRKNGCLVQVWDQGVGIAEGQGRDGAANFRAFAQRVRAERREQGLLAKPSGGGYGLGMNNVLQLCAATGIAMQLHARSGRGSVFSFMLPFANADLIEEAKQLRIDDQVDIEELRAILRARRDIPMPAAAR